jgi:hypothetical protein
MYPSASHQGRPRLPSGSPISLRPLNFSLRCTNIISFIYLLRPRALFRIRRSTVCCGSVSCVIYSLFPALYLFYVHTPRRSPAWGAAIVGGYFKRRSTTPGATLQEPGLHTPSHPFSIIPIHNLALCTFIAGCLPQNRATLEISVRRPVISTA